MLSCVRLFVTPWTVAHQSPLSMEFSKQEHCSSLPYPSPGDLPYSGIELNLLHQQADSLPLSHQGSPCSLSRAWLLLLFYTFPISNLNKSLQQASFKISFLVSFYVLGCEALTEVLSNSNSIYCLYFLVVINLTTFLFLN